MTWGGIAAGVGAIGGSIISSNSASHAANRATPRPYGVTGPGGQMGVDRQNHQISLDMDRSNPFYSLFQSMGLGNLNSANAMSGQFLNGANPEVAAAYRGTFGQGLNSEILRQLGLLRSAAAPEENRQRNALDDTLFQRGMLGTTGGAERGRAFDESISQADLQRQLSAIGLGQTNAQNRFQAALGATGQGMNSQQQQYNMGQGAFGGLNQLFQQMIQQANVGTGAMAGTPQGIAQYAAEQSNAPYQTAFNFLNQGLQNGGWGGGGYGGVPMVTQPGGPINVSAPNPSSWMPSGNFGL